jgi:hypothetical protein
VAKKVLTILACALATVVAAPAATAGDALGLGACGSRNFEQPFMRWLDPMNYVLAPDGGFEAGAAGWRLNGARVVAGNHPFDRGAQSLYLPSGSSAISPPMCIDSANLTARVFAANKGAIGLSTLKVDAIVNGVTLPAGVHTGLSGWGPSLPFAILLDAGAITGSMELRLKFTPIGLGARFQIDDVYVDPIKYW